VPGLFRFVLFPAALGFWPSDYQDLHVLYDSLRKKHFMEHPLKQAGNTVATAALGEK
jgi:hypothetical protein